jgi:PHD/YefM family antitoxin component YafN of YafNO toxin-antitoxin module
LDKAPDALRRYARNVRRHPVVVTRRGKPIAALFSVEGTDWETLSLSMNPKFLRIIERSRKSLRTKGGLTLEELQERLSKKGRSA